MQQFVFNGIFDITRGRLSQSRSGLATAIGTLHRR
jgi:hypothetical protein